MPASATPGSEDAVSALRHFVKAQDDADDGMRGLEMVKARAARDDAHELAKGRISAVAIGFGRLFAGFEQAFSSRHPAASHARRLRALAGFDLHAAQPVVFAVDFAVFDRLSIIYGGLFRGSVVLNYALGVVAFALTLGLMLPLPRIVAESLPGATLVALEVTAAVLEVACIGLIGVIFFLGHTPNHVDEKTRRMVHRRGLARRVARRWHERWLEYRLLAERFRYLELLLPLAPEAALKPPFVPPPGWERRWHDRYFEWRTRGTSDAAVTARTYRTQALALMGEQIRHHDANSQRRGAIAARLHRIAVWLFFASLLLCLLDVGFEGITLWCEYRPGAATGCEAAKAFNANWRSVVLFCAGIAPILSAAIHGILSTTEYTKLAQTSAETAERIHVLHKKLATIEGSDVQATPQTLSPMRAIVEQFAEEVINEATGWKAMLRDKNVPLS